MREFIGHSLIGMQLILPLIVAIIVGLKTLKVSPLDSLEKAPRAAIITSLIILVLMLPVLFSGLTDQTGAGFMVIIIFYIVSMIAHAFLSVAIFYVLLSIKDKKNNMNQKHEPTKPPTTPKA